MGYLDEKVSRLWRVATCGLVGAIIGTSISSHKKHYIPQTEQVQQGYAIPSKIRIELQDLDGDGQDEVLMKYGEKRYLLRLDEQGEPKVQAYEIKPAQVVPKK